MIESYNVIEVIDIMALLFIMVSIINSHLLGYKRKKYYAFTIAMIIIIIIAEITTAICDISGAQWWHLNMLANVVGFTISPFVPIMLIGAFGNELINEIIVSIPCFINVVLVFLSAWFGFIFNVTQQNVYSRGPLFIVYVLAYSWSVLILGAYSMNHMKKHEHRERIIQLCLLAFFFSGSIIQVLWPQLHISWTCSTFAVILYYILIYERSGRYDVLTDLLNRREYECELERAELQDFVTVVIIDIDNFKQVNDVHGHVFGDMCLSMIASDILSVFTDLGKCFRIGGDEFCCFIQTEDQELLEARLKLLDEKVKARNKKFEYIPTVSYGYGIYHKQDEKKIIDIINYADAQMYQSKYDCKENLQNA
jgi:diguanylate cyclase (GGDEF)-like protein